MSFWQVHGYLGGFAFIFFLLVLPRATIFFTVSLWAIVLHALTGGGPPNAFLWVVALVLCTVAWIGWVFVPRILIAVLAVLLYRNTSELLAIEACVLAYFHFRIAYDFVVHMVAYYRERKRDTWWEALGVARDASVDSIKQAYRKVAMRTHPDRKGDPDAFRKANEAYEQAKKDRGFR